MKRMFEGEIVFGPDQFEGGRTIEVRVNQKRPDGSEGYRLKIEAWTMTGIAFRDFKQGDRVRIMIERIEEP